MLDSLSSKLDQNVPRSTVNSPLFEIARVLERLDHGARLIINANHFIVRADEKLTAFVALEKAIRLN